MSIEDIDQALVELETRIERVRALYEQYFLGIERCEPLVPRKEVQRLFTLLSQRTMNNTARRFRYQVLLQRWNTHLQRWGKVLREIETGTFLPHVMRARRRGVALPAELEHQLGHRAAVPVPQTASSPVPGMSEAELRELHRRYVSERGAAVKYETLMANLERQVPALRRQLGCDRLRFVVVRGEDGQILLRALPQG